MVTRTRSARGASTLGCLVSLIVTGVVLYYGSNAGRIWWRYVELKDRMKQAALLATSQKDDQTILRRLTDDVKEIGVPAEAGKFRIDHIEVPRAITISTQYTETLDVPLIHKVFPIKISVYQRL